MMIKKADLTIADIARLAGVSKSTVSRSLSDSPLISEAVKEKVRRIAREQHFQVHQPARRLSIKQSRTIAFVAHAGHHQHEFSVEDLFLLEILSAISQGLAANHYDLLMAYVDPYDPQWPAQYLSSGRADGFILMTSTRKPQHVQALLDMEAPFIAWGLPVGEQNYCTVAGDNFTGGKLATQRLLSQGKRRVAFLGGPQEEYEVQRRFAGYLAALHTGGLEAEPALIAYGDYSRASGGVAMQRLLEQAADLDGVFVNSDLMALTAIEALRQAGRRVPEEVAVVGYDNLSIAAVCNPPLTTIHQNIPLAGRLLADKLIEHLRTGLVSNTTVPVQLVVRQSG